MDDAQSRWSCWMLYSWLIQRDSPRDASRSSNKALLLLLRFFFFAFFFLFSLYYCWVCSSQILWAPLCSPSHLRMPKKLFLADTGPCFFGADVSNEYYSPTVTTRSGYFVNEDRRRVLMSGSQLRDRRLIHCRGATQRRRLASVAFKAISENVS